MPHNPADPVNDEVTYIDAELHQPVGPTSRAGRLAMELATEKKRLMDELKDEMNACLIPDYQTSGQRIRIVYDITNVAALQVNLSEKIDNANKLWAMGVPFNTLNQRMGLGFDDIEGGDVGYIGSSMIPTSFDFDSETEESKKAVYDSILKKNLNAN